MVSGLHTAGDSQISLLDSDSSGSKIINRPVHYTGCYSYRFLKVISHLQARTVVCAYCCVTHTQHIYLLLLLEINEDVHIYPIMAAEAQTDTYHVGATFEVRIFYACTESMSLHVFVAHE